MQGERIIELVYFQFRFSFSNEESRSWLGITVQGIYCSTNVAVDFFKVTVCFDVYRPYAATKNTSAHL